MSEPKAKFQQLLRELFQFDLADLDFGIYRIMNYKRQVIERWITEDLPRTIEQELQQGALAEQSKAQKVLEEARRKVLETLGAASIDVEGNLAEAYVNTPLGKAYLEARQKAAHAQSSQALEAEVYNHLYAFFSRYYQDGDFISKRRYSKKERYAIPYNGEEVTLYWANHDQYYVKTAEHFTDYTWKAPNGVTVHFKLKAADVEQNNVKGEKRFFLPILDEIAWDEATRTLTIPFEYRPLTKQEEITYGAKNQQEAILENARQDILKRLNKNAEALAALTAERRRDAKGQPVSYLDHHLRQYTARNTRDFFIHKDLRSFLSRELDFYLKNEVLNLDELEAAGETLAEGWFQLMRLIKRVGNAIIDFLAQIEDFQKALWEKKKFVTETFYVITVGNIPEEFYGEIAACEAQWQEWQALGFLQNAGDAAGDAVISTAPTGDAVISTAPTGDTVVLTAPTGDAVISTAPTGDAVISTAPTGDAVVSTAPTGTGDAVVSTALTAPTTHPGDAVVSTAPTAPTTHPHKGWYSRGYLPHFDAAHVLQFITFRLHDSVPAEVIERWKQELHWTEQTRPDSKEAAELRKRIEQYEDNGHGACYLRDERIAALVVQALKHFDGERYRLIAWCVMPNHVHVLIEQLPGHPLSKVIHSWKSYTAHEANKLLGRTGDFWMPDYFDRFIRDQKHFDAVIEYIHQNPVKAGLVAAPEDWPWSSAAENAGENAGNASVSDVPDVSTNASVSDVPDVSTNASVSDVDADTPNTRGQDVRDPRVAFLASHPSLPLDTRHFPQDFTDRLLATFENLDEATDGLLIHSENWQALNFLQEKYRERVKCIYIDPPYNSPSSEIIYKNNYKHSTWASLMRDRLELGHAILAAGGGFCVAIDDHELERLDYLMQQICGNSQKVVVRSNPAGRSTPKGFSVNHEYAIFSWKAAEEIETGKLPHSSEQASRYKERDEIGPYEWVNFRKHGGLRMESARMFYPIFVNRQSLTWRIPKMEWDDALNEWQVLEEPQENELLLLPIDEQNQERRWKWSVERLSQSPKEARIDLDRHGNLALYIKSRKPPEGVTPSTWWDKKEYSATDWGTRTLKAILGRLGAFDYPKAVDLVSDSIRVTCNEINSSGTLILDYFAGSGTTGHAVINLNREDGGRRKFILVEMADYFDSVLLPRLKKVTFSPEWKDGRPRRMATQEEFERGPRILKVIRLESYEDALNNIAFDEESGQQALALFKDDYLLRYMLRWESRQSETFLDVEKLQSPFSYHLHIHRDGETRVQPVDLPETFNYLLGLDVQTRKVYPHPGMASVPDAERDVHNPGYLVYRGTLRNGRKVAVIWRETKDWMPEDYERDAAFVAEHNLTEGADETFVNGDSLIPGAQSLDGLFKARLFGGTIGGLS